MKITGFILLIIVIIVIIKFIPTKEYINIIDTKTTNVFDQTTLKILYDLLTPNTKSNTKIGPFELFENPEFNKHIHNYIDPNKYDIYISKTVDEDYLFTQNVSLLFINNNFGILDNLFKGEHEKYFFPENNSIVRAQNMTWESSQKVGELFVFLIPFT